LQRAMATRARASPSNSPLPIVMLY
jgi:hypothetical protein